MCQSGWRFANKMQSDKKNAQNLTSPNLCKNLTLNNKHTSGASNFQLLLWFPLPRVFNDDSSFSLTSRLKSKPKIQNRLYGHIWCLHCNICVQNSVSSNSILALTLRPTHWPLVWGYRCQRATCCAATEYSGTLQLRSVLRLKMSWHLRWGNIRFLTGGILNSEFRRFSLGSWQRPAQSPGSYTSFL